jgi:DICT domain-containing protein/predicted DNA-binding transcriptional regulator AlpA
VSAPGLTIREVVRLTGVEAPTLRMWEQRHGFPTPERLPSGHRRYHERDVEMVHRVLEERAAGLELKAAIAKVTGSAAAEPSTAAQDDSVYAGMRKLHPELEPYLHSKRTLVSLSHAIEDECCAKAERGIMFAAFQEERFYRHAEARWRDLAGPARYTAVLADFDGLRRPEDGPIEVPIHTHEPIGQEWAVICDAPGFAVFLSGRERPGQDAVADRDREFETIWCMEPELVRESARIACDIAERSAPGIADGVAEELEQPADPRRTSYATLTDLTSRMVAYASGSRLTRLPGPRSSAAD